MYGQEELQWESFLLVLFAECVGIILLFYFLFTEYIYFLITGYKESLL